MALLARGRALAILASTLACIGFGIVTEATIFRLAGFDPLDFTTQSLGAVLAGLALLFGGAGDPEHDPFSAERLMPGRFGFAVLGVGSLAVVIGAWRAFA